METIGVKVATITHVTPIAINSHGGSYFAKETIDVLNDLFATKGPDERIPGLRELCQVLLCNNLAEKYAPSAAQLPTLEEATDWQSSRFWLDYAI